MSVDRRQEKPSPILMLAPIGIVLLGYQYLFHSQLSADLRERQRQETVLQERTQNIQREQSSLLSQLQGIENELLETVQTTETIAVDLARAEAEKGELQSFLRGEGPVSLAVDQSSVLGQLASILTTTVSTETSSWNDGAAKGGSGQCHHMNSLCAILDAHELRRLENSTPSSTGFSGLVASEKKELESLLTTSLPEIARFQLQLEGSFPNLVAALHEISDRLPAVSVLAVTLEPAEIRARQRFWKLELGIRG